MATVTTAAAATVRMGSSTAVHARQLRRVVRNAPSWGGARCDHAEAGSGRIRQRPQRDDRGHRRDQQVAPPPHHDRECHDQQECRQVLRGRGRDGGDVARVRHGHLPQGGRPHMGQPPQEEAGSHRSAGAFGPNGIRRHALVHTEHSRHEGEQHEGVGQLPHLKGRIYWRRGDQAQEREPSPRGDDGQAHVSPQPCAAGCQPRAGGGHHGHEPGSVGEEVAEPLPSQEPQEAPVRSVDRRQPWVRHGPVDQVPNPDQRRGCGQPGRRRCHGDRAAVSRSVAAVWVSIELSSRRLRVTRYDPVEVPRVATDLTPRRQAATLGSSGTATLSGRRGPGRGSQPPGRLLHRR